MVMNLVMFVLFGAELLFLLSASRYLKSLGIGLNLTHMLKDNQIPATMHSMTRKAELDYIGWNSWRTGAVISMIATVAAWWGFYSATELPFFFLLGASLSIGWTLASAWIADFSPEWTIKWHDQLIRIHDTITMDYIHERMLVIADQLQKQDDGEITLTSVEQSTINYEVAKMAELIVSISRRNPDLIE